MKIPRWEPGRQGTGYRKLRLLSGRRFDVHLIDYPKGTSIPWHSDQLEGRRHLRANLAVPGGARLLSHRSIVKLGEVLNVFWSDAPHAVTKTTKRRLVLSIGVAV